MNVIGIDPGYDRFGVSVAEKINGKEIILYSDCIETNKKEVFSERLFTIGGALEDLIKKFKPRGVALETLYMNKNQKTGMRVSEARGACIYIAGKYNLQVFEYTPTQIKETICGYGRADKKQLSDMVQKIVTLPKKKRLDDEYDAIATSLTCIYRDINILST